MEIVPGKFYHLKIDGVNRSSSIIKVKEVKKGIPPRQVDGEILNPDGTIVKTKGLRDSSGVVIQEHQIDEEVKHLDLLDIQERHEDRIKNFFGS